MGRRRREDESWVRVIDRRVSMIVSYRVLEGVLVKVNVNVNLPSAGCETRRTPSSQFPAGRPAPPSVPVPRDLPPDVSPGVVGTWRRARRISSFGIVLNLQTRLLGRVPEISREDCPHAGGRIHQRASRRRDEGRVGTTTSSSTTSTSSSSSGSSGSIGENPKVEVFVIGLHDIVLGARDVGVFDAPTAFGVRFGSRDGLVKGM